MVDLAYIRQAQAQRLLPALRAWDEAKECLGEARKYWEDAVAHAKTREEHFRAVCDDVRRTLGVLDPVTGITNGLECERAPMKGAGADANRPIMMVPGETPAQAQQDEAAESATHEFGGLLRKSSRPLFPNMQRSA